MPLNAKISMVVPLSLKQKLTEKAFADGCDMSKELRLIIGKHFESLSQKDATSSPPSADDVADKYLP